MTIYGGIEAGGTKFNCIIADGPQDIRSEIRIPTTSPEETLSRVKEFFTSNSGQDSLAGIGIGSFGPVDLLPGSPTYGHITTTPKAGWANTDILGYFVREFDVPVAFDTDVNAAAMGEQMWGAAAGLHHFIYLTIGTGIGGGGMINGALLHGLVHPEIGHMRIPHDWAADPYPGDCPYHGDCFEGLANGPAISKRWGKPAESLPPDHPAWELEAHYIALALQNLICDFSPQRLILGGGVMHEEHLFPRIRSKTLHLLNGYIQSSIILENIDGYIVKPGLGNRAGVLGTIALIKKSIGEA